MWHFHLRSYPQIWGFCLYAQIPGGFDRWNFNICFVYIQTLKTEGFMSTLEYLAALTGQTSILVLEKTCILSSLCTKCVATQKQTHHPFWALESNATEQLCHKTQSNWSYLEMNWLHDAMCLESEEVRHTLHAAHDRYAQHCDEQEQDYLHLLLHVAEKHPSGRNWHLLEVTCHSGTVDQFAQLVLAQMQV